MCLAFMDFYPANERSVYGCQSVFVADPIIGLLGGTEYQEQNSNPEFDTSTLLYQGCPPSQSQRHKF